MLTRDYKFEEIVDLAALEDLLENLYQVAGIPSAIIDLEGKILTGAGWQRICLDFHRRNPEAEKICIKSDTHIACEINSGSPFVIYECPHGLVDSCCPVIIEGHHVANVFTGQILHTPLNDKIIDRFKNQAQLYGFDEADYLDALSEVPIFPIEKHKSILEFISQLAVQIAQLGLSNLRTIKQSKRLQESEEKYRKIFNNDVDAICVFDIEALKFLDVNAAFLDLYGYTKDEIENLTYDAICKEAGQFKSAINKAEQKEDTFHSVYHHNKKDGTPIIVELSTGFFTLKGKKVVFTVTRDITSRLKAEKDFRRIFELSPDMVCIADIHGCFKKINPAFPKILGYEEDELLAKPFMDFIHPEDKAKTLKIIEDKLSKGETVTCFENRYKCKDGQYKWLEWISKPITEEGIAFAIARDVTARKKAKEDIIRAKREWERTFDALPDIITIQDKDMVIVRANKAAHDFFEVDKGELNGKHCYEIFRGTAHPCADCPELETIGDCNFHSGIIKHDGLEKTFTVSSAPVVRENGELEYLVHVAKDITEQKKLEEQLFQSHKMEAIGTLAGGIAHDFNNILTAMIGYSEIIKIDASKESDLFTNVNEILKAGQRAKELVKQILTFSRKSEYSLQPMLPHPIVQEAMKMLRSSIPTTISIKGDINSACGAIMADATQFHQTIVNLCTNALHSMEGKKGILKISLDCRKVPSDEINNPSISPGTFVILEVSDTGQGIDRRNIDKIFEPYFTTKESGKGTGLGLAVIHGIVNECKGFIKVDSKLKKGSTFKLYFPAQQELPVIFEEREQETPIPSGHESILVVDDDEAITDLIKKQLEKLGYDVSRLTSSKDAIETFNLNPDQFDLIITDLTMPNYSGIELAEKILGIKPDVPIILCTGYGSNYSKESILDLGFSGFLSKPIGREELAISVRKSLDGK